MKLTKDPAIIRTLALILLAGGGIAMTVYASFALWLVSEVPTYAFYLGLSAMAIVAIVLTGFASLLIKRTIRVSKDGLEISDQPNAIVTTKTTVETADN